jgi:DNA replication protein DnaC
MERLESLVLRHIAKDCFPILLVDELGYLNLRPEQTNSFFKLMEERYNRVSTIITTNLLC